MFGGQDGSSNFNDAWTFNLTSYTWTLLTITGTKPSARGWHSSILYNGQMVVFGGYVSDTDRLKDTWTLDLAIHSWHELITGGTKPNVRSSHLSIVNNGQMVMFGGMMVAVMVTPGP